MKPLRSSQRKLNREPNRANDPLAPTESSAEPSSVELSLFFFSGDESAFPNDKYQLVIDATRFADNRGFSAVWTPERHFHRFGGLYPNPAVLGRSPCCHHENN